MPEDAEPLSELAFRSKSFWGYSPEFMESCRSELRVDGSRIGFPDFHCYVARKDASTLGFYIVEENADSVFELEALFVEPDCIGSGVGRALLSHALKTASASGAARMIIQGDPNAGAFYTAMGAVQVGTRESESIPDRLLPLYEIDVQAS